MLKRQVFISILIFISSLTLVAMALWWKNSGSVHIYTHEEQREINAAASSEIVEFIYNEQEQRDIAKWKGRTMTDFVMDAFQGDRAALYNLGEFFFLGLDFPIDVQMANTFFDKAASLGFAPALHQISTMYIDDESNGFLGLVYKNLTISFGHTEFTQEYHNFRYKMMKTSPECTKKLFNEIERIAAHKKTLILENQKNIQNKHSGKKIHWLSLRGIRDEDYQYDEEYWIDICDNNDRTLKSFTTEDDKVYLDKLHKIYYQEIIAGNKNYSFNFQEVIKEMKNNAYSDSQIEMLKKNARAQAKKNYVYVCRIEKEAEQANKFFAILESF